MFSAGRPEQNPAYIGHVIHVKQWLVNLVQDPTKFRAVNGWLTVIWFVAAFPICIFLSQSVPFLVFISVYAVVTGHLATWQAARVEEHQELDDDVADVSKKVDDLRLRQAADDDTPYGEYR